MIRVPSIVVLTESTLIDLIFILACPQTLGEKNKSPNIMMTNLFFILIKISTETNSLE